MQSKAVQCCALKAAQSSWLAIHHSLNKLSAHVHVQPVEFYKAWDEWGALSNFSPHAIRMPEGPAVTGMQQQQQQQRSHQNGVTARQRLWKSVEHFYQAQKFAGARLQELQYKLPKGTSRAILGIRHHMR